MAKLVAAVLVVVAVVVIALMLRETKPPAVASASSPAIAGAPPAASLPSSAPAPPEPPPAVKQVHAAMQKQIALLARDDFAAFEKSFAVPVTREQFELCKKRMKRAHLSPDWEMAEITEEQGHRVVRVSIFGKGMTAFRETDGGYVADTVWCVPLW